jgi:hypothetical protein
MLSSETTFTEYLCQNPQLSGFVNLYSNSILFSFLPSLTDTQIFIPTNTALYNAGNDLNNFAPTQIDENLLYSLVPITDSTTQCTFLPGYSVEVTPISVNDIPILTITRLARGNIALTIDTYLIPTVPNPDCLPQ